MTSSLYARYEKVQAALKKSGAENGPSETQRRLLAEEAMLRQVLDWLSVNSEEK